MKRKEVKKKKKEKIYVIYDYFYKTEDTAIDSLAFKDKEKANHICDIINGQKIVIYETSLQISSEKTNNTTVIITMIRI